MASGGEPLKAIAQKCHPRRLAQYNSVVVWDGTSLFVGSVHRRQLAALHPSYQSAHGLGSIGCRARRHCIIPVVGATPAGRCAGLSVHFYSEFFTLVRIELLERVVVAHGREDVIYAIRSRQALELHVINVCTILPHYPPISLTLSSRVVFQSITPPLQEL